MAKPRRSQGKLFTRAHFAPPCCGEKHPRNFRHAVRPGSPHETALRDARRTPTRRNDARDNRSQSSAADARERQLNAEPGSGDAHTCLLTTQDLAEDYRDRAWHTDVVVREGQPLLTAVADRSVQRYVSSA